MLLIRLKGHGFHFASRTLRTAHTHALPPSIGLSAVFFVFWASGWVAEERQPAKQRTALQELCFNTQINEGGFICICPHYSSDP